MPDPSMLISPVWVMVLVLGGIYSLGTVALFGPGTRSLGALLGAGVGGAVIGQVASDMAGWRLIMWGDLHVVQATLAALVLLILVRRTAKRRAAER